MFGFTAMRARTLLMLIAVSLAAVLGAAPRAMAQGQIFPPPISTESLERSLGRYVNPSPEQRVKIHEAHDRYLAEFRRLEDAELEAFSKQPPPMLTGGDMGAWMRKYAALRSRVIALDTAFAGEVAQSLPEAQRSAVDRIRIVRETQVLRTGMLSEMGDALGGGGRADLGDLIHSADLPPDVIAKVDPLLREHESRLFAAARKASDESERLLLDLTDRMQKAGLWGAALEEAQQDPAKAAEIYARMAEIMRDAFGGIAAANGRIADANRRSYREIRTQLPFDSLVKVHPRWLTAASPTLGGQFPETLVRLARRAQGAPGVTPEAKQAIEQILVESVNRVITMLDASETAADAMMQRQLQRQFDPEAMADNQEAWKQEAERMQAENLERQRVVDAAIAAIRSHLPPEVAEKLQGAELLADGSEPPPPTEPGAEPAVSEDRDEEAAEAMAARASPFEVGIAVETLSNHIVPWSVADLKRLIGSLAVEESTATMTETLHGDYLVAYTQTIDPLRQSYDETRARMYDFASGSGRMDLARAEESYEILRRLVDEMNRIDTEFFASLSAVLGAEHASTVALERAGRVTRSLGRTAARNWIFSPNTQQPIDVVQMIREFECTPEERRRIAEAVAPLIEPLMTTSRRAFDAHLDAMRLSERSQAEIFTERAEGMEAQVRAGQEYQKRMQQMMATLKPIDEARRTAQRQAVDAAVAVMPEARRPALDRAWDKACYPSLFTDAHALHTTFEKVERLGDLTDAQRTQVTAALTEYREAYEIACDALLAAASAPVPDWDNDNNTEYFLAIQNRERSLERMRFERQEMNARAAAKLRQILTPEQLEQFRTLVDPSKTGSTGRRSPW